MLTPWVAFGTLIVRAEAPLVEESSSPSGFPPEEEEEEEEVSGKNRVGAASSLVLAASVVVAAAESSFAFSAPEGGGGYDEDKGLLRSLKPSAERVQPLTWLEILVGCMPRARAAAA